MGRQIVVTLNLDEESLLNEAGMERLDDAISQELGWLHDSGMFVEGWSYVEPEMEKGDVRAQVMSLYQKFSDLKKHSESGCYAIASDMASLERRLEGLVSDEELFVLASKLDDAHGGCFLMELLHDEYVEALADVIENGLYINNNSDFPELSAEDALELLLNADNQVFGTLIEAVAVHNYYRYSPYDYRADKENLGAVFKAIESVAGRGEQSVEIVLEDAKAKSLKIEGDSQRREKNIGLDF